MKIIQRAPNPSGAYSSIQEVSFSKVPESCALVPDTLDTAEFYQYNGFVTLEILEGVVVAIHPNVEAYEEWKASLPEPQPDPPPQPDEMTLLKAQVEAQGARQEFLEDCVAELAAYVY